MDAALKSKKARKRERNQGKKDYTKNRKQKKKKKKKQTNTEQGEVNSQNNFEGKSQDKSCESDKGNQPRTETLEEISFRWN